MRTTTQLSSCPHCDSVPVRMAVGPRAAKIGGEKQGNFAYYRIVDESVFALCAVVCGSLQRRATRSMSSWREGAPDARAVPSGTVTALGGKTVPMRAGGGAN